MELKMGESKRRKKSDLGYGIRPRGGVGIMLIPDFYEEGTTSRSLLMPSQLHGTASLGRPYPRSHRRIVRIWTFYNQQVF